MPKSVRAWLASGVEPFDKSYDFEVPDNLTSEARTTLFNNLLDKWGEGIAAELSSFFNSYIGYVVDDFGSATLCMFHPICVGASSQQIESEVSSFINEFIDVLTDIDA